MRRCYPIYWRFSWVVIYKSRSDSTWKPSSFWLLNGDGSLLVKPQVWIHPAWNVVYLYHISWWIKPSNPYRGNPSNVVFGCNWSYDFSQIRQLFLHRIVNSGREMFHWLMKRSPEWTMGKWYYIWLVVWNIVSPNIWDNPTHWLIFFEMVKTTNPKWYTKLAVFSIIFS